MPLTFDATAAHVGAGGETRTSPTATITTGDDRRADISRDRACQDEGDDERGYLSPFPEGAVEQEGLDALHDAAVAATPALRLPPPPDWVRDAFATHTSHDEPLSEQMMSETAYLLADSVVRGRPRLAEAVSRYATGYAHSEEAGASALLLPTFDRQQVGRLFLVRDDRGDDLQMYYDGDRGLLWPDTSWREGREKLVVYLQAPLLALEWEWVAQDDAAIVSECMGIDDGCRSLGMDLSGRNVRAFYDVGTEDPAASDAFALGRLSWAEEPCGGEVVAANVHEPGPQFGWSGRLSDPPAAGAAARLATNFNPVPLCRTDWRFAVVPDGVCCEECGEIMLRHVVVTADAGRPLPRLNAV